ncbi:DUF3850 domain-containing protein [Enterococcus thailandicus]|uniref:DUF3850 domain-containing protein n=1 Tax=Enterococcus thailandicus TaxID=417368 RepID=UPI0022E82BF2|nr:DUF3850 domain-containing protein [Enterococcus thailandicus]
MTHELKIDSNYFEDILNNFKKFEIRKNDRNFSKGDTVILKEIDSNKNYTSRKITVKIIYITNYEQKKGYVVFGFERI